MEETIEHERDQQKPRKYRNGDKPGAYQLASVIGETTINPGHTLKIKQFITGYGNINGAKIQAYISSDTFDKEASYIIHSASGKVLNDHTLELKWGATTTPFENSEFRLMIGGISLHEGMPATSFLDADNDSSSTYLISEKTLGNSAPFEYILKTKHKSNPGIHYINFYLTYYNGEQWTSSEEKIQFKINNVFEKYNRTLSLLAAIALIVTIIHDGLYPFLEVVHDLGKFIEHLR